MPWILRWILGVCFAFLSLSALCHLRSGSISTAAIICHFCVVFYCSWLILGCLRVGPFFELVIFTLPFHLSIHKGICLLDSCGSNAFVQNWEFVSSHKILGSLWCILLWAESFEGCLSELFMVVRSFLLQDRKSVSRLRFWGLFGAF